ncbi:MAG TPA: ribonuclease HII [Candidatus Polarisedimenticolaceae bacterium]|nr:ribonuclease HII [Candidatus Polarisedimenticolaceae bacterium]
MATSSAERRARRRALDRMHVLQRRERELRDAGVVHVAGVDEVGVGPLAGPVVAAAVVFDERCRIAGIDDSKRLGAARRIELARTIREVATCWSVFEVAPAEIDRINIYQASLEAMRRALLGLRPCPDHVLVDARRIPDLPFPQEPWVRGDARCYAIAAASILAKTARDERMQRYDVEFPGYGFADHKGYATAAHRDAIRRLGPSPIHRRSFVLLPHPSLFD